MFSEKIGFNLDSTVRFFDWADSDHANMDRAVHFHGGDVGVPLKLESRVRKLKKVLVLEVLADSVVVHHWIRTVIFKDRKRIDPICNITIVDDESQVANGHR